MAKLVIVESPAKARTIGQYLGTDYTVMATMGHLRDLPKSGKGMDESFTLQYVPIEGKEETIRKLQAAAKKSDGVFLATDPDREGEAISWHVAELLELPADQLRRVTFNAITKREVQTSIQSPRGLDYPLIDAQQARRALDRIVGYEISPLLWRKIKSGLSAGRVQSVATRLVVDREEERRAFVPEEYWSLTVTLNRVKAAGTFDASYYGPVSSGKKTEVKNEAEASAILEKVRNAPFSVRSVTHSEKKRSPAPPFSTSTLQQEASNRLGLAPKRTMALAQQLYEGVEVEGHGLTGLITYMRTDSLRLSDEAVADARSFIGARYGKDYLPPSPRVYKSKAGAQDAHEAIRPSYVELPPEAVRASLNDDQFKVYKLIWDRFIACQMQHAVYDLLTIDSVSADEIFRANHTTQVFAGFTAVYETSRDETEDNGALPDLSEGEPLTLQNIEPKQHFTKPPARYTEATLIRAMEEQGIGRPSTYAPTLSTITDREYVLREDKQLRPTPLGEVLTGYMKNRFTDIVDVAFTARMEEGLDEVENGKKDWRAMLRTFYDGFSKTRDDAEADLQNGRLRIPDEPTDQICDQCGKPMVIKMGRFGRYVACTGYPDCKNTRPLSEATDGFCPLCGGVVLKKKSRKGYSYYGCEKNPGCPFMTWDTPQKTTCPDCGKTLFRVRYQKVPICENPACKSFVPEESRGYKKKAETSESAEGAKTAKTAKTTKTAAKKSAAKKTASKKTAKTPAKKPAAKKTPAKKPAGANNG
ncbi:MAG: type I DNA topoisomerase [Oscillospiraceae bacterium]|jgi:DNA topoisomerase-1|nr:type I DNA topoisomerase [Oscillospiraceae bacterium]